MTQAHRHRDLPLAPLTTLGLGGHAAVAAELTDAGQVADLAEELATPAGTGPAAQVPVPIGGGSNVLVDDAGLPGPVILVRTHGVTYRKVPASEQVLVTVQAGHSWQDLVDELAAQGLVGMESMTGIPGTVGAMPVQNVGAYGQETADTLVQVVAWDWQTHRQVTLNAAACQLSHRNSRFKRSRRWLILEVTFEVRPGSLSSPLQYREVAEMLDAPLGTQAPVIELMSAVQKVRATKGMLLNGADVDGRSAGSVFLSPAIGPAAALRLRELKAPVHDFQDGSVRVSASWLMREAGLALGQVLAPGVRVSTRHYTLVADDGATTAAFVEATARVQDLVHRATGVLLTPEPDPIGNLPHYHQLIHRAEEVEARVDVPE